MSNEKNEQQQIVDRINNALSSNIPHIYFNGYINTSSGADILVVLEVVGRPVGSLHMSTAGAKGFAAALMQTVTQHESAMQETETRQ